MNLIKYRFIFLAVSGLLVGASVVAVIVAGLKPGIDFVGGTLWQVRVLSRTGAAADVAAIQMFLNKEGIHDATVFPSDNQSFLVRMGHVAESDHQRYFADMRSSFGDIEELRFENIGPSIGNELRQKAYLAIALVLLGISLYIAYAFRKVSYPITSWKYGVITLVTLFHDIAIPAGLLALFGWKFGIEVDTNFVVALLVVMGFSVHDTIVVFDRIRENLLLARDKLNLASIINESIVQTIARSVNTSFTLVLVLLALFFMGPVTLKYFVLTILVGTVVGAYSSIFVASPLLLLF